MSGDDNINGYAAVSVGLNKRRPDCDTEDRSASY
jgi:hypothetical protein